MSVTESQLREQYRNASDEQLLFLAQQGSSEYTETAWALLREEMTRRGLPPTPVPRHLETVKEPPAESAPVVFPLSRWGEIPDTGIPGFEGKADQPIEPKASCLALVGMELTTEQARAFVGPVADYYLSRWVRIREGRAPFLGFNWAACMFSLVWLLYRRMFLGFWIALAVAGGVGVLEAQARRLFDWHALGELTNAIRNVGGSIVLGAFGSYWYYLHARRQLRRLKARGPVDLPLLAQCGGTDWNLAVLAAVAVAGMLVVAALFGS